MGIGLENALGEITLVLFTALAPSGALACIIMGVTLLSGDLPDAYRRRLNQFLAIPFVVALVGLVASATHLGNPGNALYVLTGIGRSPLSNEVLAGVVFLGIAGSYWLYSFTERRRPVLERVWIVLMMAAGAVFVCAIAFAYQVDTIITWSHPLVPTSVVLNALLGGPLLALVAFAAVGVAVQHDMGDADGARVAAEACPGRRMVVGCLVTAGVALVVNVAVYIGMGALVLPQHNAIASGSDLVPFYGFAVVLFAACAALGTVLDGLAMRTRPLPSLPTSIVAAVLALAGIFIMRFTFYMMHLTVGISF